ncbi:DNA-binding transcriptional activator [uncultured Pleomorphomonas sp.]|uniref:DNA-binding transcriptional activator n=1 Tax=uncultured Pleomorphomonas sp. TaxID=442121 RepID=A0A212L6T0_9HYPH|nr:sugar diacid recognition domain-containing protein [Pleomorphomonas carboxyditropha]SCM73029.1 DNA-binding transcriptional activator [uncultured Pleomorphomonas sp.]
MDRASQTFTLLHMDAALAQSIVERSMQIIDCNVNVMDARGIIIASGDRSRIGTMHQGALLVLDKQDAVEIDGEMAKRLNGVKPGVNLPLRSQNNIVGCIGLTGEPGDVSRFAELVRLAAETMLEQARLMQLLARDARLRETLVHSLLRGEDITPWLRNWAERLGLDLGMPRVVAVIEVTTRGADAKTIVAELERLHGLLNLPSHRNLVATISLNEIVVLKPALDGQGKWDLHVHRQRIEKLLSRMNEETRLGLRIALGRYFPGEQNIPRSYQLAKATLAVGKRRWPERAVFLYDDLRLPVMLDALGQNWLIDDIGSPIDALAEADRSGQLLTTLNTWFDQNMHMGRTAEALGIHRNTLEYRMRRIRDLTRVEMSSVEECFGLYLGCISRKWRGGS